MNNDGNYGVTFFLLLAVSTAPKIISEVASTKRIMLNHVIFLLWSSNRYYVIWNVTNLLGMSFTYFDDSKRAIHCWDFEHLQTPKGNSIFFFLFFLWKIYKKKLSVCLDHEKEKWRGAGERKGVQPSNGNNLEWLILFCAWPRKKICIENDVLARTRTIRLCITFELRFRMFLVAFFSVAVFLFWSFT